MPVRYKKILTLLAACVVCMLMMTGCWDDAEINGRAFVLGFGADSGGEAYSFTFQLAIPVSGESDSSGSMNTPASRFRKPLRRQPSEGLKRTWGER